jgi:hypothetical protein
MTAAADVLRRAAEAYDNGALTWGREWFVGIDVRCRCVLGAIAWAVDPDNEIGNPLLLNPQLRRLAEPAVAALADYLIEEQDAVRVLDDLSDADLIETVGRWNDGPGGEVADVINALEGAARRADRVPA